MDTQTIELIGRHRLTTELLRAGLEVAHPARDRGIDLIAYADLDQQLGRFVAKPIQMKAATQRSFGIWKKYSKINDLIVAFVWHLDGSETSQTYALTCQEAITIGEALGWTKTASWNNDGGYSTSRPGAELCRRLEAHLMTPESWWRKVTEVARQQSAH